MEPSAAVGHFIHVYVDRNTGTPVPTIIRAVYENYSSLRVNPLVRTGPRRGLRG